MAAINPIDLIKTMSKKICMHSDFFFRTNKQTGKTTTGKVCFPSEKEPTQQQIAVRNRFAKVTVAVRAILQDSTEKAKLEAEFKAQTKYGSLFGFAMHKLNSNYDANGDLIPTLP